MLQDWFISKKFLLLSLPLQRISFCIYYSPRFDPERSWSDHSQINWIRIFHELPKFQQSPLFLGEEGFIIDDESTLRSFHFVSTNSKEILIQPTRIRQVYPERRTFAQINFFLDDSTKKTRSSAFFAPFFDV